MVRISQQLAAAVVDQHDMQFTSRQWAVEVRRVGRNRLAGGAAGQQPHKDGQLRHTGDQLLDAQAGNMQRRQGDPQIGVAFIRADHEPAGFGNRKVDAGDSRLGRQKLLAQVAASRFGQVIRIRSSLGGAQVLMEDLPHLLLLDMDGRQHNMTRGFLAKLDDSLTQVGVHDLNTVPLEEWIQMTFLGQHRFALGNTSDSVLSQNLQHQIIVFRGVGRPVNVGPHELCVLFELFQVICQLRKRVSLDGRRLLA